MKDLSGHEQIISILQKFGTVARTRIASDATGRLMVDGRGMEGTRNPNRGIGTLRRITGRLARSITGAAHTTGNESIFNVTVSGTDTEVEIGSSVPYAATHEMGFSGSVNVPAHSRVITQAFGRSIPATEVFVRSHVRTMNIPARPYLSPAIEKQDKYLNDWLSKNMEPVLSGLANGF